MTLLKDYPTVSSLIGNEKILITDPSTSDPANNVLASVLAAFITSSTSAVISLQNVGNAGQGIAKSITSNVAQFYNVARGSTKISVSLDSINNNVLIDVVPGNININSLGNTPLSIANGGTGVSTSTGSGAVVLSISPSLTTPSLGVSSAISQTINGTAGNGYLEVRTQSSNPSSGAVNSIRFFSNSSGQFAWKRQTDGFVRAFNSTLTADRTFTLQDSSDTFVMRDTTDTLTNKTFDTAATGNVFQINGTPITDVNGSGAVVLENSPFLTKIYNETSLISSPIIWTGQATTSGGDATFYPTDDGTPGGNPIFSNMFSLNATAHKDTGIPILFAFTSIHKINPTSIDVNVGTGAAVPIGGGDSIVAAPDGTNVYLTIIGN